jgi:hypothetical protein
MAWWEGGGGSWEGKEVRWWATDRLVRGPTVTLAAFRSLRPCTCWIMADRRGGGVAVEGKCGVRNPQTASWSTHPTWWSHLQIDRANAEIGAVTVGLLGATSCPPVGGVYQGGLSPSLRGMSPETPESMFIWEGPGSIFDPRTKSQC